MVLGVWARGDGVSSFFSLLPCVLSTPLMGKTASLPRDTFLNNSFHEEEHFLLKLPCVKHMIFILFVLFCFNLLGVLQVISFNSYEAPRRQV